MTTSGGGTGYMLDNAAEGELERLHALEATYDARTREHLLRLGAARGSRALLVGGGAGGIATWLADLVGDEGRVVVTDIDPRFLTPLPQRHRNLEVLRHDIVADGTVGAGEFDLVQCRLLLGHLPERELALERMAAALAPGGGLLVEEYDWGSYGPAYPSEDAAKAIGAFTRIMTAGGFEPQLGRRLPTMLRRLGLEEVDAIGVALTFRGVGSASLGPIWRGTFQRLLPRIVASGLLTAEDIDRFRARMADPEYDFMTQTLVSAWGRRPAAARSATTEEERG